MKHDFKVIKVYYILDQKIFDKEQRIFNKYIFQNI